MDSQTILPTPDFSAAYYDPPHVQWWALSVAIGIVQIAIGIFAPVPLRNGATSLVYQLWGIYLCTWIRRLNPHATSIFWITATAVTNVLATILAISPDPPPPVAICAGIFDWLSFASFIVAIYVARAELVRHYNNQEDHGLLLGPFMTFFFSFVYFQYHLYDIAEWKKHKKENLISY